jgi:hypothetical protein
MMQYPSLTLGYPHPLSPLFVPAVGFFVERLGGPKQWREGRVGRLKVWASTIGAPQTVTHFFFFFFESSSS